MRAKVDRVSLVNPGFGFRLRCDIDCNFRARVEKLPRHTVTLATSGRATGGRAIRVTFPPRRIARGRYRITVSLVAPVNPGPAAMLATSPFRIS